MSDQAFLDSVPLAAVFFLAVFLVSVSVEIGYRLGVYQRRDAETEDNPSVGAIVGATLGLSAFLLAFTFGLAASRFDARRQMVLDEANAIGTAYLRAAMLSEPERGKVRSLLREYVTVRLQAVRTRDVATGMETSTRLHDQLWSQAVAAVEKDRSPITGLFVSALNEVIDLHSSRVQAGLRSRIPGSIWLALLFVACLSMSSLGFQMGISSKRRSLAAIALVLTFPAVTLLIADLDRPGEGLLRVDQQAMVELEASMSTAAEVKDAD